MRSAEPQRHRRREVITNVPTLHLRAIALFVLLWAGLDAVVNVRYPVVKEVPGSYFLPSIDVTVVLLMFAVLGRARLRVPQAAFHGLALAFVIVRLFRIADGVTWKFQRRHFNLYLHGSWIAELVRLLESTLHPWTFVLVLAAVTGGTVLLFVVVLHALRFQAHVLSASAGRRVFAALLAACIVLSFMVPSSDGEPRRVGVFVESIAGRVAAEAEFLANVSGLRVEKLRQIEQASAEIDVLAQDRNVLAGLHGADVFVFFVESYGRSVVTRPEQREVIAPVWARVEASLSACGYGMRSHFLVSSTYGGGSWLAHATMASGAHIGDELDHALLVRSPVNVLSKRFRAAGYRTLQVAPGTVRERPDASFFAFDESLHARHFGYAGPSFSWATMPDQFVLDHVYRRVLAPRARATAGPPSLPLFVETVLISSHGPFDRQPPYVDDWSTLGDGSIFTTLDPLRFDVDWTDQHKASAAYSRAIAYDLQVLETYACQFLTTRALVVVLGDHQPNADVTGGDASWAVPIHVLSRDPALLAPFDAMGYVHGFTPTQPPPHPPMAGFYSAFLRAFTPPPTAHPK